MGAWAVGFSGCHPFSYCNPVCWLPKELTGTKEMLPALGFPPVNAASSDHPETSRTPWLVSPPPALLQVPALGAPGSRLATLPSSHQQLFGDPRDSWGPPDPCTFTVSRAHTLCRDGGLMGGPRDGVGGLRPPLRFLSPLLLLSCSVGPGEAAARLRLQTSIDVTQKTTEGGKTACSCPSPLACLPRAG